ncbi:MAG: ABC transporter ATP-binding protein [Azospirillaceae bacterium]
MTDVLEIRGLEKAFGGNRVLDNVNLSVPRASIRCLIGPNGSGKSTLLKTVMGLHAPDGGEIRYRGQRIDGLKPFEIVRLGLGLKFQIVSIYRELTVYQNLRIAIRETALAESEQEARIEDMLSLIRLDALRDVPAGILAHGQQQWLEIGMAIVNGPDLLILDEPTAGMTVEETRMTADLVLRLNREKGVTFVAVEHDMNFVRFLDSHVFVLHQGRIFFEGTFEEVRENEDIREIYFGSR